MASMSDSIKAAVAQAASGQQLDSNSLPNDGGDIGASISGPEGPEDSVRAEESTVDTDLVVHADDSEDTPKDSQVGKSGTKAEAKAQKDQKPETSHKEVITVTDETGRKKRVEIDYSDRVATKKAHELAAGSRKWQAERDQAIQREKAKDSKYADLEKNWVQLDSAFQKGGIEALADLLGGPGSFGKAVSKHAERQRYLENATPEEKAALEQRESAERSRRELEQERQANAKFREEIQKERETAEQRSMESKIHPTFDKYRFADKLGDADDEHMFDEMLWQTSLKRLEQYEEVGTELTPELIDREFRSVSSALQKRISLQAGKTVAKVVEQKKQEATENVQAAVRNGYRGADRNKEIQGFLNSGNTLGLLKNAGRLFGSKKK